MVIKEHYCINHFYSKSTEEFISKLIKGDALRNDPSYIYERLDKYFNKSEIIKKKLDLIENRTHINLSCYREIIK